MGGTGLGLSIAKEILDRNNGTIDIKSKKDEGTEVVIRIPIKKSKLMLKSLEKTLRKYANYYIIYNRLKIDKTLY